ncbi:MAG: zinc ribbon domain-containing protein [Firmicutes bacterium]|nr:zinc ribbon domain-containing protein [Bacillota bacterium]
MPIYDYRCKGCGHIFEEYHSSPTGDQTKFSTCPKCGEKAPRSFAFNSFSTSSIDASFSDDAPEYREMHYHEKRQDWDKAAKAAENVSTFARDKFIAKSQGEGD